MEELQQKIKELDDDKKELQDRINNLEKMIDDALYYLNQK